MEKKTKIIIGVGAAIVVAVGGFEINGNWIELGTGDNSSGQTMTAPFSDYIAALWVENAMDVIGSTDNG